MIFNTGLTHLGSEASLYNNVQKLPITLFLITIFQLIDNILIIVIDVNLQVNDTKISYEDLFFDTDVIFKHGFSNFVKGMAKTRAGQVSSVLIYEIILLF